MFLLHQYCWKKIVRPFLFNLLHSSRQLPLVESRLFPCSDHSMFSLFFNFSLLAQIATPHIMHLENPRRPSTIKYLLPILLLPPLFAPRLNRPPSNLANSHCPR
eukprot:gb/GEZJ01000110.1/.p3 GENE.gb/GEZJ01000110.1/~~gb/GEZJ01000110.1/.p3  ORF type:complete len:104 (-),score=2.72 gb/GEZJ01000110.1/:190-501(-)